MSLKDPKENRDSLIKGRQGEKIRFLLAGGLNTLIAYALFALGLWLLTPLFAPLTQLVPGECGSTSFGFGPIFDLKPTLIWIGEHSYLIIQWIMWAVSVPFGVLTLKHFAFRAEGPYLSQALKAYLVYLPAQLVSSGVLAFFTLIVGLHPLLGQACALVIAALISYLGHKYFTFKNQGKTI
jgi:putative flippase GtrA